jgi:tetratricopeptide (TPR) repeat protein
VEAGWLLEGKPPRTFLIRRPAVALPNMSKVFLVLSYVNANGRVKHHRLIFANKWLTAEGSTESFENVGELLQKKGFLGGSEFLELPDVPFRPYATGELCRAVESGSASLVATLLANGASVDEIDVAPPRLTPLMIACRDRRHEIAAMLLSAGADVDKVVFDNSALSLACADYNRDVLATLLSAGASVDAALLSFAVHCDDFVTATLLLAAGAQWTSSMRLRDPCDIDAWVALVNNPQLAKKEIDLVGFRACAPRIFEICVGLADLNLPAPLVTSVIEEACAPFALMLPYYFLWNAVTACKHFQRPHGCVASVDTVALERAKQRRSLEQHKAEGGCLRVLSLLIDNDLVGARSACERFCAARCALDCDATRDSVYVELETLASEFAKRGDRRYAIALLSTVLDCCARRFGEDAPKTMAVMNSLVEVLYDEQDYVRERDLLVRALAAEIGVYGATSRRVALTRRSLGVASRLLGDLHAAKEFYEDAWVSLVSERGDDDKDTCLVRVELARVLQDLGLLEDAESLLRAALLHNHWRESAQLWLGDVLRAQKRFGEAESAIQNAMSRLRPRSFESSAWRGAQRFWAKWLRDVGRHEEALDVFDAVVEAETRLCGATTSLCLVFRLDRANVLALVAPARARSELRLLVATMSEQFGASHQWTTNAQALLSSLTD